MATGAREVKTDVYHKGYKLLHWIKLLRYHLDVQGLKGCESDASLYAIPEEGHTAILPTPA